MQHQLYSNIKYSDIMHLICVAYLYSYIIYIMSTIFNMINQ